jgi:hypothetical protein
LLEHGKALVATEGWEMDGADEVMDDADEVIDAALDAAGDLPSPPAYRAWWRAYRAGVQEEEAVKRAFRCVWWDLSRGRQDDFTRLLALAEAGAAALRPDEMVGWAQASAARAVLELMRSQRPQSSDAAIGHRTRAAGIAASAIRFAQAAKGRVAYEPIPVQMR